MIQGNSTTTYSKWTCTTLFYDRQSWWRRYYFRRPLWHILLDIATLVLLSRFLTWWCSLVALSHLFFVQLSRCVAVLLLLFSIWYFVGPFSRIDFGFFIAIFFKHFVTVFVNLWEENELLIRLDQNSLHFVFPLSHLPS